jgi:hypothetical protein
MTTKHFYAAEHHHGVEFCNDYSTLFRFATKAERDAYVEVSNFSESANGNVKTEAVTRNEARRHFPNAFRMVGDFHEETDERDWLAGATETSAYWHSSNIYCH